MISLQYTFRLLSIPLFCAIITACGSGIDKDYIFSEADENLSRGDIKGAKASVDEYFSEGDTAALTWKDYCAAYVIYAMAYDNSIDSDISLSGAARCLSRAVALNPDSTSHFMKGLSADRLSAVESVRSILSHLDEARKIDSNDLMEDHDIDPDDVHTGHEHHSAEGHEL